MILMRCVFALLILSKLMMKYGGYSIYAWAVFWEMWVFQILNGILHLSETQYKF